MKTEKKGNEVPQASCPVEMNVRGFLGVHHGTMPYLITSKREFKLDDSFLMTRAMFRFAVAFRFAPSIAFCLLRTSRHPHSPPKISYLPCVCWGLPFRLEKVKFGSEKVGAIFSSRWGPQVEGAAAS